MRYSQLFGKSSKTTGTKLTVASHRYLVQAGYIRESVAGRYYFLPLGLRVQAKIQAIIKEEMDQAGSQEVAAPTLHPLELWRETNRDQAAGFELMQVTDRRGASFALGGTAEEMFVDLVRKFNLSYKDLPFNLYQFGLKFRDELRARGGLLRVREFIMKDAYSFSTPKQFEAHYELMRSTYQRIFERLGLETVVVPADGGYIGGQYCHEFVVPHPVGESVYFQTDKGYLAHEDIASFQKTPGQGQAGDLTLVEAKRQRTMAASVRHHQPAPIEVHIKNVAYQTDQGELVLACLRGDLEVNEVKLAKAVGCHQLKTLTDDEVLTWLNSPPGFISAVKLQPQRPVKVVADDSLVGLVGGISGANQPDHDFVNIDFKRDLKPDLVTDIALARAGFLAADGQPLVERQGIEVGNIFQLGFHYTQAMAGATYTDAQGKLQPYYMGCYGIGLGRTLAAIAEIYGDDKGLCWPVQVAPYDVHLCLLDNQLAGVADRLYGQLTEAGLDVLYDDRAQVRPGAKLADADLLGLPWRVVVSQRSQKELEVTDRRSGRSRSLSPAKLIAWLGPQKALAKQLNA